MKISRRRFLHMSALAGGAMFLPAPFRWMGAGRAEAFYQTPSLIPLFGTKLRGIGPGGIPVAIPNSWKASVTGVTSYSLTIKQFQDRGVCPTLGPTTLWGFCPMNSLGGFTTPTHLGGLIVAQKGKPIQITFQNILFTNKHILPVDRTIMGADQPVNRTSVHLHGGYVPWISDGGPHSWFDPYGNHGASFLNNKVLNPTANPGFASYYYPMNQSARFLWYHDHAIGITRLNAYAGIASGVLLRDSFENNLINMGLPDYVERGGHEIPLIFQDKVFVGSNIASADPTWSSLVQKVATQPGSLWYPHIYEATVGPNGLPLPNPSAVPEFFGDTMLVNGTVFPQATVEGRRYRLRMLNASNSRFLNLQLYVDDGSANGITLDANGRPKNAPFIDAGQQKPAVLQIGTEGGFLARPAQVRTNVPMFVPLPDPVTGAIDPSKVQKSLLVAPAERPDIIIDFSNYVGKNIILYNDAPAPFPIGDDANDYFPGLNVAANPVNATTKQGFGPNSRVLMRFKVVSRTGTADTLMKINTSTSFTAGLAPFLVPPGVTVPPPGVPKRFLTLNEAFDEFGRLIQLLGNAKAPNGAAYADPATEVVKKYATEVWEIYNNTGDTHPMHFHLVNVQLINRQLFSSYGTFTGPPLPPDPNEAGWKETVLMYPGTVTRIIMKFDIPNVRTANGTIIPTPPSPRTGGNEYVWHCHILEHEEHDMMRPLVVI
ncbi:MAG TPA: multicopper oxidase domain-containing protein [Desulfuromonadaceae bacterium]|jgi:spore coat protein A